MNQVSANPGADAGPHFLCIGMQKAGTGFLYECLQNMESFRLPLRKEIHHFDKYGNVHPGGVRLLEKVAAQVNVNCSSTETMLQGFTDLKVKWPKKAKFKLAGRKVEMDQPNLEFLRNFSIYVNGGAEDQAYLDLFSPYRDFINGEITPAYSTLDSEAVEHIHGLIPGLKIILCVREPVSRLWSQMNMRIRSDFQKEHGRSPRPTDIDAFSHMLRAQRLGRLVNQNRFLNRSLATQVYRRWVDVFGEENLLVINFRDLIGKTAEVLDKTCDFLGAPIQKNKILPTNRKEKAMKISLDDERREVLQQVLHDEIESFGELFDNHPDRIAD